SKTPSYTKSVSWQHHLLTIPCKSDPDLCMQLDAWDAETSIPALLNGEHSVLYRTRYDQQSDAWIMRLA
ncbi:DUF1480 family protein, partial [Shigella sonnei]|uniref:DUF1480 family protein n=1 Tax=Shigella sonnei TaxID=624 RepID=UPI00069C37B9